MFYRVSYYLPGVCSDSLLDRGEFQGDFRPLQRVSGSKPNVRFLSSAFHDAVCNALMFDPFNSEGGFVHVERLDNLGQWQPYICQIVGSRLCFAPHHGMLCLVYPSHADYLAEVSR